MADSITISITIPTQLEEELQKESDAIGISRSRHIGSILLTRQSKKQIINNCDNNTKGHCILYGYGCAVNQEIAESCEGYSRG